MPLDDLISKRICTLLRERAVKMKDLSRILNFTLPNVSKVISGKAAYPMVRRGIEDYLMTPIWSTEGDFQNGWYNRLALGVDIVHDPLTVLRARAKEVGANGVRRLQRLKRHAIAMEIAAHISRLELEGKPIPGGGGWKYANAEFFKLFPNSQHGAAEVLAEADAAFEEVVNRVLQGKQL
jgi:hypothetical protein